MIRSTPLLHVEERRSHKRLNLYLPVIISGRDREGNHVREETHSINLSASGAFFLSGQELTPGTICSLKMEFPTNISTDQRPDSFQCRAVVVRVDNHLTGFEGTGKHGVAVSFLEASDPLLKYLKENAVPSLGS